MNVYGLQIAMTARRALNVNIIASYINNVYVWIWMQCNF